MEVWNLENIRLCAADVASDNLIDGEIHRDLVVEIVAAGAVATVVAAVELAAIVGEVDRCSCPEYDST